MITLDRRKKMNTHFRARQGDVLIVRLDQQIDYAALIPIAAEGGRTILAHGEVTGHAHALPCTASALYEPSDDLVQLLGLTDSDRILQVRADSHVTHEEHAPIPVERGD